jgi:hypothetical protein
MRGNIGQADQIVRGVTGAMLILLVAVGALTGALKVLAVMAGAVGVFTAAAGFCPFYRLVGLTTHRA